MRFPKKVRNALNFFVKECKKKFGKDLVSIILFGSRVKGYAREDSDYDILILIENLPDIKERFNLIEDLEDKIWDKYQIKISSFLLEPEELFEPINPLLFGILSGYKILYGKKKWFRYLENAKEWIRELKPIYIEGEKEWKIEELV